MNAEEQNLMNKLIRYELPNCPIIDHSKITILCIDTKCPKYFKSMCYFCIKNNQHH